MSEGDTSSGPQGSAEARAVAPYGTWRSPLGAAEVAQAAVKLGDPVPCGDSVFWTERRPAEGGRTTVVERRSDGTLLDRTPAPLNVRSAAHEYGGLAYWPIPADDAGGAIGLALVRYDDQRIHHQPPVVRDDDGEEPAIPAPEAIVAEREATYADLQWDARRGRVFAAAEDREDLDDPDAEPRARLVATPLEGSAEDPPDPTILVEGPDFLASPRLSPDGERLAWLAWNHPDMPWDATELWLAELDESGALRAPRRVAGGPGISIFQPEWSPGGVLHYVSDESGFWNLYRLEEGGPRALAPREADFGLPQWVFGMSTYAVPRDDLLVCLFSEGGIWRLATLDGTAGVGEGRNEDELRVLETPYTHYQSLRADDRRAVLIAAGPDRPPAIVELDLETLELRELHRPGELPDPERVSSGRPIEFESPRGPAHAFFYPPTNPDFQAPAGELPPLLIKSHGGPTAAAGNDYDPAIQYWTSRGFALVDVNYGGSTGFGRAYRDRLLGAWGVVDVEDCLLAAQHLVAASEVDGDRLLIRGGSAGGYTTLAALTFHDGLRAGASHYGIGDLETLARDTHKFESRYLDSVVGPYPEQRDLYRERSPVHHAQHLSCPVIFFQGTEDKVVPPSQAEVMVSALRENGVPVAYVLFEGEGHGFRRRENIVRALEAELSFYAQVLGLELAEEIEPVELG